MVDNHGILFKRRYSRHFAKNDRQNHPVTILLRASVNNVAASDFSIREKVLPQHWDQKNQRVVDMAPHAQEINDRLDRWRRKARFIFDKYEFENLIPTPQQLADELQGKKSNNDQAETQRRSARPNRAKSTILVSTLIQLYVGHKESTVVNSDSKTDNGICQSTIDVYRRYERNINRYLSETENSTLRADQLDGEWMADFEKSLMLNYDAYYAVKHLYFAKTVLDYGVLKKHLLYNPIKAYPIVRRVSDEELVFLYDEEIERFSQVNFGANPGIAVLAPTLERVRDAFLAMLEIGQHYRDYCDFVADSASYLQVVHGVRFFRKKRQKTKGLALVPISEKLEVLEAKYGSMDNLPTPNLAEFNQHLKVIAALADINKNLSSKAARKTFADQHINEKETDLDTVARMMGLSSTTYIERYGRIDERRIIKKMGLTGHSAKPDPAV